MAALPEGTGDDRFTGEQAALRRVATLVARGAPPEDVFASVTEEAGQLLGADYIVMARHDRDGVRTVVAAWSRAGAAFPVGSRARLGGCNVPTLVVQTGRAARIDDCSGSSGPVAEATREFGFCAAVGVPVIVEDRLWGDMTVASRVKPLPPGTEARLAGFTELAATAIANAQARVELRGFAEEQAALRRVATLVAQGASPEKVFAAVTGEGGQLLHADHAVMVRYGPSDVLSLVATWSRTGAAYPVGVQVRLGGQDVPTMAFQTRQPARIDDYSCASGPVGELVHEFGVRASVGVPSASGGGCGAA